MIEAWYLPDGKSGVVFTSEGLNLVGNHTINERKEVISMMKKPSKGKGGKGGKKC